MDRTLASDPFEAKAWDNFTIETSTVVAGVSWVGAYIEPFATADGAKTPETDFLVEIFSDSSGPAALLESFHLAGGDAGANDADVTTSLLGHTAELGGPVYEYHASLPDIQFGSGNYWISITALQTFPSPSPHIDPTWQWHLGVNPTGADGFKYYDDTFDDPGDNDVGLVDGTPHTANSADKDLAFTLHKKGSNLELNKHLWDINRDPNAVTANVGDQLIYAFDVKNTGTTPLNHLDLDDPLPGIWIDGDVFTSHTVFEQAPFVPADGNLGPFSSVDRTLASDPFEAKAWDNFTLSEELLLNGISWAGAYIDPFGVGLKPQTDFSIEIFADDSGKPGALLHSLPLDGGDAGVNDGDVMTMLTGLTAQNGGPVYTYSARLPYIHLVDGDYWVSITALQTFPNAAPVVDPTWQWQLGSSTGGADGFFSYDDTFDDPGDNDAGENDQAPSPVNFQADKDLSFAFTHGKLVARSPELVVSPGETITFIGYYDVTESDQEAGQVFNEATATGKGPDDEVVMDMDTLSVPVRQPDIEIDKFLWDINGSPDLHHDLKPGDELIYSFNVTNVGHEKLSNVTVTDPLPGLLMDDQVAIPFIAYDQAAFVPSDGNLGPFASLDRVLASDPFEAKAWDNFSLSDPTILDGVSFTGGYIEPFASGSSIQAPETDFLVEVFGDNGGLPSSSPVFSFTASGGDAGVDDGNVRTTLQPHTSKYGGPVYSYDVMLPFHTFDSGDYWISITALQTFPNAKPAIDPTWFWHLGTNPTGADGHYHYDDTFDDPGDNDVGANDGTPFPAIREDKDLAFTLHATRLSEFNGMLEPGESVMFMGTYIVKQSDVDAGRIVNEATVTATLPNGDGVSDSDEFTFAINHRPCIPTPGDVDGDGVVTFDDFLRLSANFGMEVESHSDGDLNCDGIVDFDDFLILSAHFGETIPTASPTADIVDALFAGAAQDDDEERDERF